jgi:hypothetical protein
VVVVGRNDYVVQVVGVVVDEGFGYTVVMVVVDDGFGQVELPASALADGEYQGCIVSLRASLASY